MMSVETLKLQTVPAEIVRPLRTIVLRPNQSQEASIYPGDETAIHIASFAEDQLVGIASLYNEPPPKKVNDGVPTAAYKTSASFRLRGMATAPEARGRGVGRAVVEECFRRSKTQGADFLWCNARLSAVGFYEHVGMKRTGEQFEIEGIGPHYVMWRKL